MAWNYRVIRKTASDGHIFAIHEVYYDDEGAITSWSIDPVAAQGIGSPSDLLDDIYLQKSALDKPILEVHNEGEKKILVELLEVEDSDLPVGPVGRDYDGPDCEYD